MDSGMKVVALGGGTGLSTMLKGLKLYTSNITAVVTVGDDGGSSGVLRHDLGMLPPGDIRNCMSALTNVDPVIGDVISYRFKEGSLAGHSVGNIVLAALNEMSASFDEAVAKLSRMMGIVGKIYPVTNENIVLKASMEDGSEIVGETNIGGSGANAWNRIEKISLEPANPKPVDGVMDAIADADVIVLGPGSLYTSIIPNLLVDGVTDAIKASRALKIYVCNIMTQPGETLGCSVTDHITAIEKHSYRGIADITLANSARIPDDLAKRYALEGAEQVHIDTDKLLGHSKLMQGNLVLIRDGKARHNFSRLARTVIRLGNEYCK